MSVAPAKASHALSRAAMIQKDVAWPRVNRTCRAFSLPEKSYPERLHYRSDRSIITRTYTPVNLMEEPMTKTMKIQGVEVEVTTPYAEGHTVTEAEAKALNTIRAENIGNNRRSAIKELLEAEGATPESVQKAAQKIVAEYDKEYVFTLATASSASKVDPLQREALAIARDWVSAKLKEAGMTRKAYDEANGEEAFKSKVAEVAEMEQVIAAAKESLAQKEALSKKTADLAL